MTKMTDTSNPDVLVYMDEATATFFAVTEDARTVLATFMSGTSGCVSASTGPDPRCASEADFVYQGCLIAELVVQFKDGTVCSVPWSKTATFLAKLPAELHSAISITQLPTRGEQRIVQLVKPSLNSPVAS